MKACSLLLAIFPALALAACMGDIELDGEMESATADAQMSAELIPELEQSPEGSPDGPTFKSHACTLSSVSTSNIVYLEGTKMQLRIDWVDSSNADHSRYTVYVDFRRREGGTITGSWARATFSNVGQTIRTLFATINGIDTFSLLGSMSDGTSNLWQVDLRVQVIEDCTSGSDRSRYSSYRPVAYLVRPYPDANVNLLTYSRGSRDQAVLDALEASVESAGCDNVLLAVNGTTGEGKAGPSGIKGFMRGMGYDCVVNVAYHDENFGWGETYHDDSYSYCSSVNLAYYSLHYAWLYAVYYTGVGDNFDMYGHSKGAAIVIRRHQTWPWVATSFPNARFYAVGVPEKYGAEYLSGYELGYSKTYGPIVAMTWSDDWVRNIDVCADWNAFNTNNAHNYNGFFDDHSGHGGNWPTTPVNGHEYDAGKFRSGTYDWTGPCYHGNDTFCE